MVPTAPRRELGLLDLVFFHVAAIVSVRWISLAAAQGPESIGLWGLALAGFFLPTAWVVLDSTRRSPEAGGIYAWTREAFGPFHGFLCAWCYVVSNLFYFPAVLVTVAGYSFLVDPAAPPTAEPGPGYVIGFSIAALAAVTALAVVGLRYGKWLQNLGAVALWVPCGLVVALGAARALGDGPATPFDRLLPDLSSLGTWRVWSTTCFAFAGFELASCLLGEIRDPSRTVPRSIVLAGLAIALVYVAGTASVLACLPPGEASALTGILQAIAAVGASAGLPALTPLVAALLAVGGVASVGAWFSGAGRLPHAVGVDRYLPAWTADVHPRFGTPHRVFLLQGALATAFVLASFAGSTVRESYLVLTDATTIVYFIPYLYLFASHAKATLAPGADGGARRLSLHAAGSLLAAGVGLASTLVAIFFAVTPPADSGNPGLHVAKVAGGSLGVAAVAAVLFAAGRRRAAATGAASPASSRRPGAG
jgi:amino acid transporter